MIALWTGLRNAGRDTVSFDVRMSISRLNDTVVLYLAEVETPSLLPNGTCEVVFDTVVLDSGLYGVSVRTLLSADESPINDSLFAVVAVAGSTPSCYHPTAPQHFDPKGP